MFGSRLRADLHQFSTDSDAALRQQLLNTTTEKDPERLERFKLFVHRSSSPLKRFSPDSLRAYAHDFIETVKNIEE